MPDSLKLSKDWKIGREPVEARVGLWPHRPLLASLHLLLRDDFCRIPYRPF